jgi:hypothetical protein
MTDEGVGTSLATKHRKIPYLLGIIAAMLGYGLSLLEPSIRGPKLWAIFFCAGFAVWISVLKLRNLIHGTGWVFPSDEHCVAHSRCGGSLAALVVSH